MATQQINWVTKGGQCFPTEAEAVYAELIEDIAEALDIGGATESYGEFDTPSAVKNLLKSFTVQRIEQP